MAGGDPRQDRWSRRCPVFVICFLFFYVFGKEDKRVRRRTSNTEQNASSPVLRVDPDVEIIVGVFDDTGAHRGADG